MKATWWFATMFLGLCPGAAAQTDFRSGIDLVRFGATVVDRQGNFVPDLGPDDFELLERGKRQRIVHVLRGDGTAFVRADTGQFVEVPAGLAASEVPLHLGLLFDTSGSMSEDLALSRSAAVKFLNTLPEAEDVTLVDFDTQVRVARFGQQDFARLIERIRQRKADGMTALYDALGVYLDGAGQQDGQKVLVLYTDGGDTTSALSYAKLLELLKASDVTVYAVGFLRHAGSSANDLRMKLMQITEAAGGVALFPSSLKELDEKYEDIVQELRARYIVGYLPEDTAHDGRWRDVSIRVTRPALKGVRVRSRKGYFAPFVQTVREP